MPAYQEPPGKAEKEPSEAEPEQDMDRGYCG